MTRQKTRMKSTMEPSAASVAKQGHTGRRAFVTREGLLGVVRMALRPPLLTALLALGALVLLKKYVGVPVTDFWIYLDFDRERAAILSTLVVAAAAAGIAAMPWRRRGVAVITIVVAFSLTGVKQFLAQTYTPPLPGVPSTPLPTGWALVRALVTMYSLGATCAAVGAGLGAELGDWVLVPLWHSLQALAALFRRKTVSAPPPRGWKRGVAGAVLALSAVAICIVSLGGASDLLFYGSQTLVSSNPLPVESAATTTSHGQVLSVSYTSALFGGTQRHFVIYLPPDYGSASSANTRYPVIYALHGWPGQPDDMLHVLITPRILDSLITSGQISPVIVVVPDGTTGAPLTTEWTDSAIGHYPVESAFLQEVIPYVDAHYRSVASPEGRVLSGTSMGAFGAANLALKHPDVFGGVIAMGAYFAPLDDPSSSNSTWYYSNNPGYRLRMDTSAPPVKFFLCAGSQDHYYLTQTQGFARRLEALHAIYALQVWSGGHGWELWRAQMIAGVRWFFGLATRHSTLVP